ncbi:MAG: transporter substrate-binding domain-containing protein [Synergistaceae bacterium]|nr:transporter substrate-binding domain-containing protein [Synergistaceae bacterium]
MRNKKIIWLAVIAVVIFAFFFVNDQQHEQAQSEKNLDIKVGVLAYLGTTEKEFQDGFDKFRDFVISSDRSEELLKDDFINSLVQNRRIIRFYDSLMALIMDLKAKKLDEIILPENVGIYLLKHDTAYENAFETKILSSGVCFGFREDNTDLKNDFDKVLYEMKADGTLENFALQYVLTSYDREPEPTRPEKIKNSPDEIKIAITGDMPPIDMFAGDGKPTGYNTAVLSEISKRLNKNIKFINTDAGGRSAALMSGRADAVFWYRATQSSIEGDDPFDNLFKDAPEGAILSSPYFSWKNEIIIRLNGNKSLLGIFSKEKEK